jgi:hypothetical protein
MLCIGTGEGITPPRYANVKGELAVSTTFVNIKKTVRTTNHFKKIKAFKVGFAQNYSYFVFNHCHHNSAIVRILISPDGEVFMPDGLEIEIGPQELITLVPNYFSRFSTLEYKSAQTGHPALLTVWFQMTRPSRKDSIYHVQNQS